MGATESDTPWEVGLKPLYKLVVTDIRTEGQTEKATYRGTSFCSIQKQSHPPPKKKRIKVKIDQKLSKTLRQTHKILKKNGYLSKLSIFVQGGLKRPPIPKRVKVICLFHCAYGNMHSALCIVRYCQNSNPTPTQHNTTVGFNTKMTLQPPPPTTQTQCQQYISCQ